MRVRQYAPTVINMLYRATATTLLALLFSFLILIGVSLVAESFDQHIPKGYIYFAMAFSVMVEVLNLKSRKPKAEPVQLRHVYSAEPTKGAA